MHREPVVHRNGRAETLFPLHHARPRLKRGTDSVISRSTVAAGTTREVMLYRKEDDAMRKLPLLFAIPTIALFFGGWADAATQGDLFGWASNLAAQNMMTTSALSSSMNTNDALSSTAIVHDELRARSPTTSVRDQLQRVLATSETSTLSSSATRIAHDRVVQAVTALTLPSCDDVIALVVRELMAEPESSKVGKALAIKWKERELSSAEIAKRIPGFDGDVTGSNVRNKWTGLRRNRGLHAKYPTLGACLDEAIGPARPVLAGELPAAALRSTSMMSEPVAQAEGELPKAPSLAKPTAPTVLSRLASAESSSALAARTALLGETMGVRGAAASSAEADIVAASEALALRGGAAETVAGTGAAVGVAAASAAAAAKRKKNGGQARPARKGD